MELDDAFRNVGKQKEAEAQMTEKSEKSSDVIN